ncbi:MAG: response regulator transcription factor [Sedimentisphaerales bacterium]|jgi:two-component system response regulator NreC
MSTRIIIADDHAIVRHGLSRAFDQQEDINVIGQAKNGLATIELVRKLSPDVVVMDIAMPDLNGIEATRQIVAASPNVKVIGLSMHSSNRYVREMFKAGASGYLLKDCAFEELLEAIRNVAQGKTYVSPSVGDIVVQDFLHGTGDETSAFSTLTTRERQVLQLLAEGNTTKQVAQRLYISPKTVEAHRLRVMNKLNIDNIAQLTKYAIQEGLTLPEP